MLGRFHRGVFEKKNSDLEKLRSRTGKPERGNEPPSSRKMRVPGKMIGNGKKKTPKPSLFEYYEKSIGTFQQQPGA